jgi:branched-subunit amino acid transport protein
MTPVAQFWLLTIVLALGTWSMRSFPIMLHGHVPHPPWLARLLKHVPVAALTMMVVPGALYIHPNGVYHAAPARTIAAVVALIVAVRTKSTLGTLVAGMGALWIAQAALHALT